MTSERCRVCGEKAHGVHFGVLACRACAAFFRRTVALKLEYACRSGSQSCDVKKAAIGSTCRACRYRRCNELGMDRNGIQMSFEFEHKAAKRAKRKLEAAGSKFKPIRNMDAVEENILDELSNLSSGSSSKIPKQLESIFTGVKTVSSIASKKEGQLSRLADAFKTFQEQQTSMHWKIYHDGAQESFSLESTAEFFHRKETVDFLRAQLLLIAKLAMNVEGFRHLNIHQKFSVFSLFWPRFLTIAGTFMSLAADYSAYQHALSRKHIDNPPLTAAAKLQRQRLNTLVIPMARLEMDETEFAAMLTMCMWNVEASFTSDYFATQDIIEAGRRHKSAIFDELYAHYTKRQRLQREEAANYASRVATLCSIVHSVDQRAEDVSVLRTFGLLKTPINTETLLQ